MGNAPSSVASRPKELHMRMLPLQHTPRPVQPRPPEAVQLDFDNMPFLQPPQESRPASGFYTHPGTPLPPASSPPLIGTHDEGFAQQATFVHTHAPRMPSEGHIDHTVNDFDFFGVSTFAAQDAAPAPAPAPAAAGSPHRASSSITSQLSVLSQRRSPTGSPHGSPRSHRHSFMERFPGGQYESVDAGVPPPVPPHFVFPDHVGPKYTPETETALAVVDALEEDMELHSEGRLLCARSRSRSRSRSLSRTLTRRKSLGSESVASGKSMTTDIYTRKCSSPTLKSPESPSSLATNKSSEAEDAAAPEPESPGYEEDTSFVLEGYSEGTTKLRVVNLDKRGMNTEDEEERLRAHAARVYEKQFVKSKAQLADEEEQRIRALCKRYERYGHKYRAKQVS